jgi:3-oxoacyl-(acyl-carrier-protein) synthase
MKFAVSDDAACITGLGMVASLGYDVATICAAARAGIVRSEELDYFRFRSGEDGAVEHAVGHPIPELTRGFEGFARLLRIAQAGLADLLHQEAQAPWGLARTAFYLSLPDSGRVFTGLDLIQNEKSRQARAKKVQDAKQQLPAEAIELRLLQTAARLTGWAGEPAMHFSTTTGHTGVTEALNRAIEDLCTRQVEAAVVGGVDTLLEEDTLEWLQITGRLKTSSIPSGLQPGEAGGFLLLETVQSARARGARILGIVEDVRFGEEAKTLLSGDLPAGSGLTEILGGVMARAGWNDGQPVWLITDQNGEFYRAMEWGNVIIRLTAQSECFAQPVLWYPAGSFGDTGAASGVVSICMAIAAFDRQYAPAQTVAVVSSADGSRRSVVLLRDHID